MLNQVRTTVLLGIRSYLRVSIEQQPYHMMYRRAMLDRVLLIKIPSILRSNLSGHLDYANRARSSITDLPAREHLFLLIYLGLQNRVSSQIYDLIF